MSNLNFIRELIIISCLCELRSLKQGWDGDAAKPIDFRVINYANDLIQSLCKLGIPAPQIIPTTREGLQIEWHKNNVDIEIEVYPKNQKIVSTWSVDYLKSGEVVDSFEGTLDLIGVQELRRHLVKVVDEQT